MKVFLENIKNIDCKILKTMNYGLKISLVIVLFTFYTIYCYNLAPTSVIVYKCSISMLKACFAGMVGFIAFGLMSNKILHKN